MKEITYNEDIKDSVQYYYQESIDHPVVLILSQKWLGGTQVLHYYFEQLTEQFPDMAVYIVYQEKSPALVDQLNTPELPTTYILKDGETAEYFTGMLSERKIEAKLNAIL
jgi:thioredoxin-like negative regulator of GroEL